MELSHYTLNSEIINGKKPSESVSMGVWEDLISCLKDPELNIRTHAAIDMGDIFSDLVNKERAMEDLHSLSIDSDVQLQRAAAYVLGANFPHMPDKKQAWDDLHILIEEGDHFVALMSATSLSNFSQIPNKIQAWDDLMRLMQNGYVDVRERAVYVLGLAFQDIPDKKRAWDIFIEKAKDGNEDAEVRMTAVYSLGIAIAHMPNKKQAFIDLLCLTDDDEFGNLDFLEAAKNLLSITEDKAPGKKGCT